MKSYGQYCPVAAALDVLGDRWNLLVLRELSFGPQRFTDLRQALTGTTPGARGGVAANLLTDRLRDLEQAGLVRRDELPPPAARTVYVLTEQGRDVRPVLSALARFGAERLPPVDRRTPVSPRAALAAAITAFHDPRAAADLDQHARLVIDDHTFDLRCHDGRVGRPPAGSEPSLTLTCSAVTLMRVRQGGSTSQAIDAGEMTVIGSKRSLQQFCRAFDLPR